MTRPHNFRHADIKRAFAAAEAAGVRNPRVEVHLPAGGHFVIGSGEVATPRRGGTHRVPDPGPKVPVSKPPDEASFAKGFGPPRATASLLARGGKNKMFGRGDRTVTD